MSDSQTSPDIRSVDIAVIGMTCRFPGADSIAEYWRNLADARESITFYSDEELQAAGLSRDVLANPHYVKASGTLKDIECFDAQLFGFTPSEARLMDPQRRFFLEAAWSVLEDAGYVPWSYKGLIGVYAGVGPNGYIFNICSNREIAESVDNFSLHLASDKDFLSTYVAYKLNLRGPSVSVQTACSSSLVAVHLACQSLLAGECDMALAGGVSLGDVRKGGYLYQEGGILSPDGHCRAFDAMAKGTVGGSGVGIVVLKRLAEAMADGDTVHAVIRGSAVNNDGALKVGYTAPSIEGQVRVVKAAQAVAGVEPESISYIEAHGTGTALGDPIEIAALTDAFRARTEKKGFCAVGSVKTNIGHLDTAAGVAGLIKTVLALRHKQLPASLHFQTANPKIDFSNSPFYVNSQLQAWESPGRPRRAGVSSFGIGGTNAHVVVEEAPPAEVTSRGRRNQLLVISGRSEAAVEEGIRNLGKYLKEGAGAADVDLADAAYTLQVGRKGFGRRGMVVCAGREEAVKKLEGGAMELGWAPERGRGVIFLFPGQGTQLAGMGRELYAEERVFREVVDRCSQKLRKWMGRDVRELLYGAGASEEELKQTEVAQPVLFVIEYALAQLWMQWGVRPQAVVGHSLGEYVAACVAGVMSEADGLWLVAARGRLMQEMEAGKMLVVGQGEEEIGRWLGRGLSLAAVNGRQQCVVSGERKAIEELGERLGREGVQCQELMTSHGFHSHLMDGMLERYREEVKGVKLQAPRIGYASTVTGKWIGEEVGEAEYWVRQVREPVRFGAALEEVLKAHPEEVLLEVGPGQTLCGLARSSAGWKSGRVAMGSMAGRGQEAEGEQAHVLRALGRLWIVGVEVDWAGFHEGEKRRRVPLPTYPFQRQRYWIDGGWGQEQTGEEGRKTGSQGESVSGRVKKQDIADWFYLPTWKASLLGQEEGAKEESKWVVFLDEEGLGQELVSELRKLGRKVITVRARQQFRAVDGGGEYEVNATCAQDYEALLRELAGRDHRPQRIVHCWSVTAEESESEWSFSETSQYAGFYSLIFLAQAMGKVNLSEEIEITVVSNHLQAVSGEERMSPEKATVLGPCRVIPQEYGNIRCRNIDVVMGQAGSWQRRRTVEQLLKEVGGGREWLVAYRGQQRWTRSFEPIRLPRAEKRPRCLRDQGVYLITGGLGGVGLEMAEYLARRVQARLILTGRSPFPRQEDWPSWLAEHAPDDAVSVKIRKLQTIAQVGGEILILQADVARYDQMQHALNIAEQHFGCLHGLIHAAGIPAASSPCAVQELTPSECDEQFRAKITGVMVLERCLRGSQLDFCMLVSSLSTTLGGLGFCAYAAANAFMDAFAQQRCTISSRVWSSVDWNGWEFRTGVDPVLELTMTPEEGIETLERLLQLEASAQTVVSVADLTTRLNHTLHRPASTDHRSQSDSSADDGRLPLNTPYVAPSDEIEQVLVDVWKRLLGVGRIGVCDDFFELGGHSLLAVQLVTRLREVFKMDIPLRLIFEFPAVQQLAQALRTHDPAATAKIENRLKLIKAMSNEEKRAVFQQKKSKDLVAS